MQPHPRYEIFAEIASGDFATVYQGRDRELGREVAIKQIHRQFLSDARQLERYWQEAQLLASLQHPHIMTIYDIVRPRGWLILELMKCSLAQFTHGEPLDLDMLRLTVGSTLQALKFLHAGGVIHGDIKPSNLFVDKRNGVKLGDFGLARRVTNDRGSLLKGTTRYMAPELVSDQFGPVGPASDLYSLGFTAYELMCGPQFDSLFPGLEAFGRDKQIAWMMWHAAADRRLPEIHRVLEGVPPDLAKVIQKLVAKNPSERYRTADEALADLQLDPALADRLQAGALTAEELAAQEARRKRRRRLGIAATFAASFLVIAIVMMLPEPEPPKPPPKEPPPVQGIVRNVVADKRLLVIESDGKPKEYKIRTEDEEHLFLNNARALLRDLQDGDHLTVKKLRDETGGMVLEIFASRPQRSQGVVSSIEPENGRLDMAIGSGSGAHDLKLKVPQDLEIKLNNQSQIDGQPVTLAQLKPGDQITVEHDSDPNSPDADRQVATYLSAIRGITAKGVIRALDPAKRKLTLALGDDQDAELARWPIAEQCEITLNDRRFFEGRLLKIADLRSGDEATVVHDTTVLRIDAFRVFQQNGVVLDVRPADHVIDVRSADGKTVSWTVAGDAKVTLNDTPAQLADLHRDDEISVTHDSPDSQGAQLSVIEAKRATNPKRWALVVGITAYEDATITRPNYAASDARLIGQTLTSRFQVETDHLLLLTDLSRIRLEQSVPAFLDSVPNDAQLLVFLDAQAYADPQGKVYLMPTDGALARLDATGVLLGWFVGMIERCPAEHKLLLFDSATAGKGDDLKGQPSAAEMLASLKTPGAHSPLRTLTAIVSCGAGQRSEENAQAEHGRFAWYVAAGLTGAADKNKDNRLEPTELFEYLKGQLAESSSQTPELILPDATPPRLSEEAKTAIRKLAADLQTRKLNLKQAATDFEAAQSLAGNEPEPKLLYALLLTKAQKEKDALKLVDELRAAQPDLWVALELSAWLHFRRLDYLAGVVDLTQLLNKLAALKGKPAAREHAGRLLTWAGKLREYAGAAAGEQYRPPAAVLEDLDRVVEQFPPKAQHLYADGRQQVRVKVEEFDKKINAEEDKTQMLKLQVVRRQLVNYAALPIEPLVKNVLEGLDEQPGEAK